MEAATTTPNAGRKWWGWGTEAGHEGTSTAHLRQREEEYYRVPPPMREVVMPAPRVALAELPPAVAAFCTDDKFERALHSRGCSFVDQLRNLGGRFDDGRAVDLVAFPASEAQVAALLAACSEGVRGGRPIAVVPWGGGSSVSEGLGAPVDDAGRYAGCVCVDLLKLDRLLAVDALSLSVTVQAGMYGPALEAALRPHGLTLRHYPQSFEFSTAGGWVATRGAGHFATAKTHIDEFVQSVRVVTPRGDVLETRRLPGSGAGPAEHRQYVGSEGIYGVITQVSLRVLKRAATERRAKATVLFPSAAAPAAGTEGGGGTDDDDALTDAAFMAGARCVRRIVQSGLQPANLRLVDGTEAAMAAPGWAPRFVAGALPWAASGGREAPVPGAMLLLGFEGERGTDVDAQMRQALAICADAGGVSPAIEAWRRDAAGATFSAVAAKEDVGDSASQEWGASFKAGGYRANHATVMGLIAETFETAVTWDQFEEFHASVLRGVRAALRAECGPEGGGRGPAQVSCRFTHVYPDGVAPYYTCIGFPTDLPPPSADFEDARVARWLRVKRVAMAAMIAGGGTCTHHHAVGRMHRPAFERERGALFGASLAALKRLHDPAWIMNPGVLVDEALRDGGGGEGAPGGQALQARLTALEEKLDLLLAKL